MPHAGGRPTKYSQEILDKTVEYIDLCEDDLVRVVKQANTEKGYEMYENKLKVKIPTIEGLALHLDINKDTVQEWRKEHEEFSVLIDRLLAKQANALVNNGISGDYNPTIAKVLLTKHGYREGTETDVTSGGKTITSLSSEVIAEAEELLKKKKLNE